MSDQNKGIFSAVTGTVGNVGKNLGTTVGNTVSSVGQGAGNAISDLSQGVGKTVSDASQGEPVYDVRREEFIGAGFGMLIVATGLKDTADATSKTYSDNAPEVLGGKSNK